MKTRLFIALLLLILFAAHSLRTPLVPVLEPESANVVFDEARTLSDNDGGDLWGVRLYGPMLLVDPDTRRVIANEQDSPGTLQPDRGVYTGQWPEERAIANTAIEWSGKKWTMLLWPLPANSYSRREIIAHELWHRVQSDIGLHTQGGPTTHLGSRDGRVWLQLEWRALAIALRTTGSIYDQAGDTHEQAVLDALSFRDYRRGLFPEGAGMENALEMHEGLAQYTGFALSGRSPRMNREKAASDLKEEESNATFVRSFAYASGPAYGLLLDAKGPSWRENLSADDDLGERLATAYDLRPPEDLEEYVSEAAGRYNGGELIEREDRLEAERQVRLQDMRRKFVNGPVLELPFYSMQVQFDPRTIEILDDLGNVYGTLRLSDQWGILTATDGALITKDWKMVVVPAPEDLSGTALRGEGYTLELKEGWEFDAIGDREGFVVRRNEEG